MCANGSKVIDQFGAFLTRPFVSSLESQACPVSDLVGIADNTSIWSLGSNQLRITKPARASTSSSKSDLDMPNLALSHPQLAGGVNGLAD